MKKLILALALLACTAVCAFAQQSSDPCQIGVKIATPITITTPTTLINGAAARKNYICSFVAVPSGAETVSLVEGTGNVCATSPLALIGGATAASGLALPTNGILAVGSGSGTIAAGTNANFNVCLLKSGTTNRVSGVLIYVQQ